MTNSPNILQLNPDQVKTNTIPLPGKEVIVEIKLEGFNSPLIPPAHIQEVYDREKHCGFSKPVWDLGDLI